LGSKWTSSMGRAVAVAVMAKVSLTALPMSNQ